MGQYDKAHSDDIRRCEQKRDWFLDQSGKPRFTTPEEEARLKEQAKTFPVTRLPYRGPRRHARVQFVKRTRAVSVETGLAFEDYKNGMHIHRRADGAERWVPEFANNDNDLRLVLAQSTWNYMLRHHRVPDEFVNNLGDLKQMAEAYFEHFTSRHQGQAPRRRIERIGEKIVESIIPCDEHYSNMQVHAITVKRAGGYLERDTAVAYYSWRLRHESPIVGEELGMTATHVRHILGGLCATARKLGFDALPPAGDHTRGMVREYRPNSRIAKLPYGEELVDLVLSGQTLREIADRFGVMHEEAVRNGYLRAKKLVTKQMRDAGSTWEEINARFATEPKLFERVCRVRREAVAI